MQCPGCGVTMCEDYKSASMPHLFLRHLANCGVVEEPDSWSVWNYWCKCICGVRSTSMWEALNHVMSHKPGELERLMVQRALERM